MELINNNSTTTNKNKTQPKQPWYDKECKKAKDNMEASYATFAQTSNDLDKHIVFISNCYKKKQEENVSPANWISDVNKNHYVSLIHVKFENIWNN